MKRDLFAALTIAGLALAFEAWGHHSFDFFASTEDERFIVTEGTITDVRLVNPHSGIFLNVAFEAGETAQWGLETRPAVHLLRRGWTNNTLKVGQHVKFAGERLRDENRAWFRAMLVPGDMPDDVARVYIELEALDPPEREEFRTRFESFPACEDIVELCYELSAEALISLHEEYGDRDFLIPASTAE